MYCTIRCRNDDFFFSIFDLQLAKICYNHIIQKAIFDSSEQKLAQLQQLFVIRSNYYNTKRNSEKRKNYLLNTEWTLREFTRGKI